MHWEEQVTRAGGVLPWLEELWKEALRDADTRALVRDALEGASAPAGRWVPMAVGKAAAAMAAGAVDACGDALAPGIVVTKDGHGQAPTGWSLYFARHPVPDARSLTAGQAVMSMAQGMGHEDQALLLLSGGASALLALPAAGISLEQKAALTQALLRVGADIHEMNCVRKHLSALKGGGLLRALAPACGQTLAISDVFADRPDAIGSGIAVPDPTTYAQALEILHRYDLHQAFPTIDTHLQQGSAGAHEETLKPAPRWTSCMPFRVLASNAWLLRRIAQKAEASGLLTLVVPEALEGPMPEVHARLQSLLSSLHSSRQTRLLLVGGEPTLHVTGSGLGGRMQHLGLLLLPFLYRLGKLWGLLAGSDGTDGPTDAAGALLSPEDPQQAPTFATRRQEAIQACDSYHFHRACGTLLHTGPTGTNVRDVGMFLFAPTK